MPLGTTLLGIHGPGRPYESADIFFAETLGRVVDECLQFFGGYGIAKQLGL